MKNTQKGFIFPLLIAIIAVLVIGGGVYFYTQNNPRTATQQQAINNQIVSTSTNKQLSTSTKNTSATSSIKTSSTTAHSFLPKSYLSNDTLKKIEVYFYQYDADCNKSVPNEYPGYPSAATQCRKTADAVKKIDPVTFTVIKEPYYKDKNNVYVTVGGIETNYIVALDADPNTFQILDNTGWGTDKNNVYYAENKIVGADPNTFQILDKSYADDKLNQIAHYAKDKINAYFVNESYEGGNWVTTIPNIDNISFHVLQEGRNNSWASDKNHVYYGSGILVGADPVSFEFITTIQGLAKDKQSIFLYSTPIQNIDVSKLSIKKVGKDYVGADVYSVSDGKTSVFINNTNTDNRSEILSSNQVTFLP